MRFEKHIQLTFNVTNDMRLKKTRYQGNYTSSLSKMTVTCIYILDTKSHFGNQKTYLIELQISVKIINFNNVQEYVQF